MGAYIYRVTAKRVKCNDGKGANVAKYAYKPYMSVFDEKLNKRMAFRSGCYASDRLAREGKLTDRLVVEYSDGKLGDRVYANPRNLGTFYDDYTFGTDNMPVLEGVSVG